MIFSIQEIILLFFIYSFLGWCVEVAFVATTLGKVLNRGFLNGPVCPIYGCGMLLVLIVLHPVSDNIFLLFLGGMVICSAIELFGGWILDKLFHMRWWDYSDRPFNVGGYICLSFSIMWGLAVVFAVKLVHTPIMAVLQRIPDTLQIVFIILFGIILIIDMVVTLKHLIGIRKNLGQLEWIAEQLHGVGDQLKDVVGNSAIGVKEKAEQGKEKLEEATVQTREKIVIVMEEGKEKLQFQKEELEKLRAEYAAKINKSRKYIRNSLVALNKSGKSIKILEYIKDMMK